MTVKTYCINKGTTNEYYGLIDASTNHVLYSAPNNWKTEHGALRWAEKHGFEIEKSAHEITEREIRAALNVVEPYFEQAQNIMSHWELYDGRKISERSGSNLYFYYDGIDKSITLFSTEPTGVTITRRKIIKSATDLIIALWKFDVDGKIFD